MPGKFFKDKNPEDYRQDNGKILHGSCSSYSYTIILNEEIEHES
ncbi:unnamed protein product, partial [marine sediment metagenome]